VAADQHFYTVISKKLILIIFIVFYCVNVGVKRGLGIQDTNENLKESENVVINVVLLKNNLRRKCVKTVNKRKTRRNTARQKEKRKGNNKPKGKPVFDFEITNFVKRKQYILTGKKCRNHKQNLFCIFRSKNILTNFFKYISNTKTITKHISNLQFYEKKEQINSTVKMVRNAIIYLLLLMGNVEINPGPPGNSDTKTKVDLVITTFNCNGLGNRQKRIRILNKAKDITSNGGVVMLQETHLIRDEEILSHSNNNFQSNPYRSNSAGVITLMPVDFKVLYSHKDEIGRQLFLVVENNEEKYIVVNVYCPNDHRRTIGFLEEVYIKILEIKNTYPDTYTILAGDFNSCISNIDYMNRTKSNYELELTKMIEQNNNTMGLIDSYREKNKDPGFTWCRGDCYSRLDYIYVSNDLTSRIKESKINWGFGKSDHAAVTTTIRLRNEVKKGPGIVKVNTRILKDASIVEQIRNELIFLLDQVPEEWNGHKKLDFMKVMLRSTIAKYAGIERRENQDELATLEDSLNDIELLRQQVLGRQDQNQNEKTIMMNKINIAKIAIKNNLEIIRNKLSKEYDFKATAKWYEYGEKPNKFFLNLNKFRNKQKMVEVIKDKGKTFVGQSEVMEGIRNFYQSLYKKKVTNQQMANNMDPSFYKNCPKLSDKDKNKLDSEVTLGELFKALQSCKDTAPGPDGIPYSVYKVFWNQVGHIIKESWDYSVKTGITPNSHRESTITILPKEGKDHSDIKNWRPITLSNCDAKIITKALAMRINPILESIIDPSQTAYVPGRSVMDNIRSNKFLKDYCNKHKVKAALVSLDACKAFDSVDHEYIDLTLEKYGFGNVFRTYFKTIYTDITARILVNGYFSEIIRIERGVKQGDALSCAIFIICIDPLLRNINGNDKIKGITLESKISKTKVKHKACGFADDVSVICQNDIDSINQIFHEYQRLSDRSGLILNADKTEIINLNTISSSYIVNYEQKTFEIKSIESVKICGIYNCSNDEVEYKLNVLDKIEKLKANLKIWKSRRLTMEGKSLILKTFGIAQLIYVMQCTNFRAEQLKQIERFIFNFLWETKNYDDPRARDRIKRSILKNDYNKGGLKITDIECLERSLKVKQYVRANRSHHTIKNIQQFCVEENGGSVVMCQDFIQAENIEAVCQKAQETINIITASNRNRKYGYNDGQYIDSKYAINQISMIKVQTYLAKKERVFLKCIHNNFKKEGLIYYRDIVFAAETEMDKNRSKRLEAIISAFPTYFREVANSFNPEINSNIETLTHILKVDNSWTDFENITTKDLQWILKNALDRLDEINIAERLEIEESNEINILQFRKNCKNSKLRNIHFRLLHNDFFTYKKMFKFKMSENPNCPRCNEIESTKHLLWECNESRNIWNLYNSVLTNSNLQNMTINKYEDIFITENLSILSTIKMKIVQEFIQIERPKGWSITRIENLIMSIRDTELYNAKIYNKAKQTQLLWKSFMHLSQ